MTFFQPPHQVTPPTCKTTGAQAWMGGMELLLPDPGVGGSRQVGEATESAVDHVPAYGCLLAWAEKPQSRPAPGQAGWPHQGS